MTYSGKNKFFRELAVVTAQEWLGVTFEAAAAAAGGWWWWWWWWWRWWWWCYSAHSS